MQSTLRLMASEAGELRPGGETVITRLADMLVVQAIRAWMETDPAAHGLAGGAAGRPDRAGPVPDPWRPGSGLDGRFPGARAGHVPLGVCRRFTELVDEPVMSYLARWRMHVALAG